MSSCVEIDPGFNVLQQVVNHNAALKHMHSESRTHPPVTANNGKKYSQQEMMEAAKAVNLPMSELMLTD